jgi:hypothetical protein
MLRCATPSRMVCFVVAMMWCTASTVASDNKSTEKAAHDAYVAAINSNNVDTLLADLTDDIVYQTPGEPEIVGKADVRKWLAEYFGVTRTHWEKCRSASSSAATGRSIATHTSEPTRTKRRVR